MKAVLIRVGIDYGYGAVSPIFADDTYVYIPIYYKNKILMERNEKRTYNDIECKYHDDGLGLRKIGGNTNLAFYLPKKLRDKVIHLDPEFESYTYGEPGSIKRASLLKLNEGDLLVFYLGGKNWDDKTDNELGVYIFGYFTVRAVYDWNNLGKKEQRELSKNYFSKNAHIISSKPKKNLVIVKGFSTKSKKFKYCIKISEPNINSNNPCYISSKEMRKLLGIREFITRAVPIWIIDEKYIKNLQRLLLIKPTYFEKIKSIGLTEFINIINNDNKLFTKEKEFVFNFLTSANYGEETDSINFESDLYGYDFKNKSRIKYYFKNLYGKILTY